MKLDGREFSPVDQKITAAQQDYIQAHLALSGVNDLFVGIGVKLDDDRLTELRKEFVTRVLLSGQKAFILAGLLTERGKQWSRAEADRNAAIFDGISDPKETQSMSSTFASLVISFFQSAAKSSPTSPSSSSPNEKDPATKNADLETLVSSPQ